MKLDSLHIKNYKLFQDLEIYKLGQVNLITGKNNTGKTILLEALRVWASEGDASVVNNIIWKRGDWDEGNNLKAYSSLFSAFEIYSNQEIQISTITISPKFIENKKYLNRLNVYKNDKKILKVVHQGKEQYTYENVNVINIDLGNKEYPQDKAIFVPASIEFDNKKLWSNIDLTDKKDNVIQILQIIEPSIIDIGIIDNIARVRTKNSKIPVPLKNFGEGLNRLLTIAMALVSAEDNLLLIDEIDTGLHYSVQKQLWEIIFEFAKKLNIQVFVTTHSEDCIKTFYSVSIRKEFEGMGQYLRLGRKRGSDDIGVVEYELEELEIALESNIETR